MSAEMKCGVTVQHYSNVHKWLSRHYEKQACEQCGKLPTEWANVSGSYQRNRSDFLCLCRSCHRIYDNGDYCKNGHLFSLDNTYRVKNRNMRVCKTCTLARVSKYSETEAGRASIERARKNYKLKLKGLLV